MIASQHLDRLDGLAMFLHRPALRLVELCEQKLRRRLLIVSTFRSLDAQQLLYQKGRIVDRETGEWIVAVASDVVTKAKPGSTAHNVVSVAGQPAALAVDVVPLCEDGTADWLVSMSFWDHLYELSWKVGLDPLGDVTGDFLAGDLGHFQEPGWKLKLDGLGLYLPTVQEQRV